MIFSLPAQGLLRQCSDYPSSHFLVGNIVVKEGRLYWFRLRASAYAVMKSMSIHVVGRLIGLPFSIFEVSEMLINSSVSIRSHALACFGDSEYFGFPKVSEECA